MALRSLRKEFAVAVAAGEQAIRINTDEHDDAIKTIAEVCRKYNWQLRVWDQTVGGVRYLPVEDEEPKAKTAGPAGLSSDSSSLSHLAEAVWFWQKPADPDPQSEGEVRPFVLVMKNFHLGFEQQRGPLVSVVQHLVGDKIADHPKYKEQLKAQLYDPKDIPGDCNTGKFLVGLMPAEARIPREVEPLFKTLDHELPDLEELLTILEGVNGDEPLPGDAVKVCQHALGLTRLQAEGVFTASIIEKKRVDAEFVWQEKARVLNREGLVEVYQGQETFNDVVGLTGVKEMLTSLLTPDEAEPDNPDVRGKGILLVGGPGVGKSLIAKAAGNSLGLPMLQAHPGNLMGEFVGTTERNTRKLFQVLKAMAPCLTLIDEVEKVMPSARGGDHDSGVGRRMAGTFMTQMNDMTEPVYWLFTANSVEDVHEAFFRAERVDGVFYVPLPTPEQRASAWAYYIKKFFPAEINGKPFARHVQLDVPALLDEADAQEVGQDAAWIDQVATALMSVKQPERDNWLNDLTTDAAARVRAKFVDDEGWTPAEIRACCRLSRLLKEPPGRTARRVRPVSVSAKASLDALEKWAENAALDAETGELYAKPTPAQASKAAGGGKVRRTVRTLNPVKQ